MEKTRNTRAQKSQGTQGQELRTPRLYKAKDPGDPTQAQDMETTHLGYVEKMPLGVMPLCGTQH